MRRLSLWALLLVTACDCGDDPGEPCDTAADCADGELCLEGFCTPPMGPDGSVPDGRVDGGGDPSLCVDEPARQCAGGRICCDAGEECVDDYYCFPICTETRCGDNGSICCGSGQICLDGVVCAAECAAEETLCGAANDVCCGAGDVCLDDVCATPGDECGDDFDCLTEGEYCETVVGRCLPIPDRDPACELLPDFDAIEIEEEWHWEGEVIGGTEYDDVAMTPVVGDVSGDGVPDVIVTAYAATNDTILVALDGRTGVPHWRIGPGTADDADWISTPVVANFDPSDDALEILYWLENDGIRVVDGDGVTEIARRADAGGAGRAAPTVADFDGDGTPDVILGCHAMNGLDLGNPAMDFFDLGECRLNQQDFLHSVVADLDGDGEPEVTTGGIAIDNDGSILWGSVTGEHALAAVADLDADGTPEVIAVRSGHVRVFDGATGAVLVGAGGAWFDLLPIPGGGAGGAPTIADFDGDGLPEISAAGRGAYAVYDPDCLESPPRSGGDCAPGTTNMLRWQAATQDISSSVTGSSVFDFQGDGVAEVVYNDECFLHIYDGRTGAEVLTTPRPNSSRTGLEYPLVVDVDRDGNSEIVVPANRDQAVSRDNCDDAYALAFGVPIAELPDAYRTGTRGVYVLGDPGDRWVRTRPIWNQYAYHVTNVSDRGDVPAMEPDNWTVDGLNNYRQNVQGTGVFNAPNLVATLDAGAACARREIQLSTVVTNLGSRGVPAGVGVQIVQTGPGPEEVIFDGITGGPLLPGQSERITTTVTGIPTDTDLTWEVRVDGVDGAAECLEDDNTAVAMDRCPGIG